MAPELAVIPVIATEVVSNKTAQIQVIAVLLLLFLVSMGLAVIRAGLIVRELAGALITKRRKRKAEPTPVIETDPVVTGKFYDALYKPRSW